MPSFFWLVARHIPSHFPQPLSLTHAQSTSCLWLYVFLWSFWCWQPFCSCAARRRHRGRLMVSVLQLHVYHFFTMNSNQDCCLSPFHRSNPWLQKHKGTVYFYLLFLLSLLTMCTIFFLEPNQCLNPAGKSGKQIPPTISWQAQCSNTDCFRYLE